MNIRNRSNLNVDIRPSDIHGHGVFARKLIRCGEWIGRYLSRRTRRDGVYVLWVRDEATGREQGYEGYGRLRFLNHHPRPNAAFDGLDLYAIRDIWPGEEITIHYGDEWEDDGRRTDGSTVRAG